MRVAVICPYGLDRPGGVQSQAKSLVSQLRRRQHDAWLVAPGAAGFPEVRDLGASLRIPANRSVAPISLHPQVGQRLREAVAGAEVVHVHEPLLPLVSLAALRTGAAPIVGTFHADPPGWVRQAFAWGAGPVRRKLSRLDSATAVSPVAAGAVSGLLAEVVVIPNAIDTTRYRAEEGRLPRVTFLGRDERRKGLDVLLGAWPTIHGVVPEAELVVLGADRHKMAGVSFVGTVDDQAKREYLASTGVFCAPNLGAESFGMIVLEAMAAGSAIVASDLPGFRYVAGDTARYVSPGDSVQLAEVIVELLRSPDEIAELAGSARARSHQFDWTEVVPRYEAIYQSVLGSA